MCDIHAYQHGQGRGMVPEGWVPPPVLNRGRLGPEVPEVRRSVDVLIWYQCVVIHIA
jgi:hypothetical protein